MDPREYDWQMGDLAADPYMGPDERRMQPAPDLPPDYQWQRNFATSTKPAWEVPPTNLAAWPLAVGASPEERAAYTTQSRYRNALARDPTSNQMGALAEMVAPQSPIDYALLGAGPLARTVGWGARAALYGGALAAQPTEAEAMLAGPNSRTANLDKMRKAAEMLMYGKTPAQIRAETDWFPTAGGILKYEIPDKGSKWAPGLDPSTLTPFHLPAIMPSGSALLHPRAYEAYPGLADVPMVIRQLGPGTHGGFMPRVYENDVPRVYISPASSAQMRRVAGHELFGHGVQDIERATWSTGGNPDAIYRDMKEGTPAWDEYLRIRSAVGAPMSRDEYMAMADRVGVTDANYDKYVEGHNKSFRLPESSEEQLKRLAAQNIYEKTAGEEEARAIALRMNLGPQQIKSRPFEQSLQTPFEQQIFEPQPPLIPGSRPPPVFKRAPPSRDPVTSGTMGDLADTNGLVLSRQQTPTGFDPTNFAPGKVLAPETQEYANPRLRAKAEKLFGKYPQYAENYPETGPPQLMSKLPDPDNPGKFLSKADKPVPYATMEEALAKDAEPGFFLEKKLTPQAEQFQKDRATILKDMDLHGYPQYFDPAKRFDVDPKHYGPFEDTATAAAPKTVKTYDEWYEKYGNPEARARLQAGYEKGQLTPESEHWYWMGQLEQKYMKELGAKAGRDAFKREFADMMAATTGGASPYNNWLMAHYAGVMAKRGERMPERSYELPFPIGGRFAAGNIEQAQKYIDEGMKGFSAEQNPKRYDFSSAFQGNKNAFVMDEQMMQAIEPGTNIPQWYGPATRVGREEARAAGTDPREFQDVGWAGLKGLKTEAKGQPFEYEGPMIGQINRSIEVTHRLTGMPREEIVRRGLIRKEIPMYTVGGAVMGGLAAQDEYR